VRLYDSVSFAFHRHPQVHSPMFRVSSLCIRSVSLGLGPSPVGCVTPLCPCGRLSRTLSRGSAFLRPQTTMPRLTPTRTSGFRSGCPCSPLHSPAHALQVSRVHGRGPLSGWLCGGVFFSVSLPLFGAPHPLHRGDQVDLCSRRHVESMTCAASMPANWVCRFDEDG